MGFRTLTASIVGLGMATAGCVIGIDNGNGGDNGGGGDQTITIRVVNQSNTTLDPEVYISGTPVGVDQLFADANKFTKFGVGTLGLLGPTSSDTFTVACADARVLGTKGGRFGDDLNNPTGTGRQIVLTQDLSIFCGSTLTLTYSRVGGGFDTTYTVTP